MTKRRRKKNKPNIPQATLERAREQAGVTSDEEDVVEEQPEAVAVAISKPTNDAPAKPRRRRSRVSPAQLDKAKQKGDINQNMMIELLVNPTIEVTEEQLHQEYSYVLKDLRNMGLLAAALLVLLIGLAQFI